MDGVHVATLGKADDLRDVEIHAEGAFVLADEISLIRLDAEKAVCVFL